MLFLSHRLTTEYNISLTIAFIFHHLFCNKIVLSIIIANNGRSYNLFFEIIEKYVFYILSNKLKRLDYNLMSLSYSSDLTFEKNEYIINIKFRNKSDYLYC